MSHLVPTGVRFRNATIGYERHPAVHHASGVFGPGTLTAVVGPNGAGKSTLLKSIVGLVRPFEGTVAVEGCPRRAVAYLPQQADIDRSFPIPVFDFVAMGLWRSRGLLRGFRRRDDEAIAAALGAVGLAGFEDRGLDTLSGGQLQRVLFARLALQDSPLILLDEPFSAIDERTSEDLMRLVHRWHAEGRTIVAVLHDLPMVRAHFPLTLLIARHVIGWGPTPEILTTEALTAAGAMTEAWDDSAPICELDVPA